MAPGWVLAGCISLISALSVIELLNGAGIPKKRLIAYAAVFSACVPIWVFWIPNPSLLIWTYIFVEWIPLAFISVFVILLFTEAVINHEKIKFTHLAIIFTSALIIPYFLSSLVRIAALPAGRYYILLPLIAAFLCDSCAYFAGVKWGRRKFTPVSPKKTVEGAIGGIIGTMLGMTAYWFILNALFPPAIPILFVLLYGLLGSAAGILGDLSMSLVKREFGIKDFGSILPGHGGVLDRFDSILFAAPVLEVMIRVMFAVVYAWW
jgi:phosphatidate cytidylyltransferase